MTSAISFDLIRSTISGSTKDFCDYLGLDAVDFRGNWRSQEAPIESHKMFLYPAIGGRIRSDPTSEGRQFRCWPNEVKYGLCHEVQKCSTSSQRGYLEVTLHYYTIQPPVGGGQPYFGNSPSAPLAYPSANFTQKGPTVWSPIAEQVNPQC